ncbi:MAG: hypothetical protein V9E88_15885 [Ferruginibacter sp.]
MAGVWIRAQQRRVAALVELAQPARKDLEAGPQQLAAQHHQAIAIGVNGHLNGFNMQVACKKGSGLRFQQGRLAAMLICAIGIVEEGFAALWVKGHRDALG